MSNLPSFVETAVLQKPFEITMEKRELPVLGPNDVLIKVMAVGVCGSDVHYYEHGKIGRYVVEKPLVLGHECAGEVVAVGDKVKNIKLGDRVAIEPGVTCGTCDMCKSGRYNLCPDVQFMATPPVDGAFAQYVKHREDFVYVIPDELSYEEAALIEPFSVGLHAMKRANVQPGATVAIMGIKPVGLLTVVAAKSYGASKIIVGDVEDVRLEAALKLGATHAIQVKSEDAIQAIGKYTNGAGVDFAFETAGNGSALKTSLNALKRGGTLAVIGLPQESATPLNIPTIVDNEVNILGIFRYANTYETAIRILTSGQFNIGLLVTDQYPLAETKEALEQARTNKSKSLKVMVYPNGQ